MNDLNEFEIKAINTKEGVNLRKVPLSKSADEYCLIGFNYKGVRLYGRVSRVYIKGTMVQEAYDTMEYERDRYEENMYQDYKRFHQGYMLNSIDAKIRELMSVKAYNNMIEQISEGLYFMNIEKYVNDYRKGFFKKKKVNEVYDHCMQNASAIILILQKVILKY